MKNDQLKFNTERMKRIDQLLSGYIDRGEISCASAVVGLGSEIHYQEKFGWQNLEDGIRLADDTIFYIMSMTKPIVAAAAMLLYEEAAFDLNTPISQFLAEFEHMHIIKSGAQAGEAELVEAEEQITFRHLFTHSSGIGYGSLPDDPADKGINELLGKYFQEDISIGGFARQLSRLPLAFEPGSSFRYGLNLDVLGALIESISGQNLEVFLQERLFDPLGMDDTTFLPSQEQQNRLAVVYCKNEKSQVLEPSVNLLPLARPVWGGGGLLSTIGDYTRFTMMLANGGELDGQRILSPTTVAMFSSNYASPGALSEFHRSSPRINAGFGFSLGTAVLIDPSVTGKFGNPGEFYWGGAYSTYFWVDPVLRLHAIFMTALTPNWVYPIPWQFHQLVYQAIE